MFIIVLYNGYIMLYCIFNNIDKYYIIIIISILYK